MTKLVYRLEVHGEGPYTNGCNVDPDLYVTMIMAHGGSREHPGPVDDPELYGLCVPGNLFGCSSIEKLESWFGPFLRAWLDRSGVIAAYEVADYLYDDGYQVVFDAKTSHLYSVGDYEDVVFHDD